MGIDLGLQRLEVGFLLLDLDRVYLVDQLSQPFRHLVEAVAQQGYFVVALHLDADVEVFVFQVLHGFSDLLQRAQYSGGKHNDHDEAKGQADHHGEKGDLLYRHRIRQYFIQRDHVHHFPAGTGEVEIGDQVIVPVDGVLEIAAGAGVKPAVVIGGGKLGARALLFL